MSDLEHRFGCTLPKDFEEIYRLRVATLFESSLESFEGVHDVLARLSVPACIATSAPLSKVEPALKKTDLAAYFGRNIFSSYAIDSWKPEPGIFLHAARQMGAEAGCCLVLDDSEPGIQAAKAAAMNAIQFCGSATPFHEDYICSYGELEEKMAKFRNGIEHASARGAVLSNNVNRSEH